MPTTRRRRPALIVLVGVAALGCLGLAWWQWTRWESMSGSFQNLGYALQWPMFAVFCCYAYVKFVRYEQDDDARPGRDRRGATEVPEGLLPQRPAAAVRAADADPALAEYNAYLAHLAETDRADRTAP